MDSIDTTVMLLEPAIERGFSELPELTTSGETIHGILAAMRRLRENLTDIGGPYLAAMADDAMRDRLAIRTLQYGSVRDGVDPMLPPEVGALGGIAEAIMLNAADTCSRYATNNAASRGIFYVLLILLDRLVEAWGRPLTGGQLIDWLDNNPALEVWSFPEHEPVTHGAAGKYHSRSKRFRQSSAM